MANTLSDTEIQRGLPSEWEQAGTEIHRTYEFDGYLDGVAFVNAVAEVAEEQQHHPTIEIGYGSVTVTFTTHEADGITNRDLRLAALCEEEY